MRHKEAQTGDGQTGGRDWLQRLQWRILRPLATTLGGDERSLIRGPGMELNEVREYQPGDDVRLIDWNITARADRPFVRESHVERSLDVWLLLDLSASVQWGTADCTKRERAVEFAAVASQLLNRHGNRIGAIVFADRPLGFIPLGSGRNHVLRLLAAMREVPRQARRGRTDLKAALVRANTTLQRRSLVLVVSDFLAENGWQPELGRLAQRHEVVGVRLQDPRESALPDIGLVVLEDPETGSQLLVNTADRALRDRFQAAAQAQAERINRELTACGVDQLALSTDTPLLPPLLRFLGARQRRRAPRQR